MENFKYEVTTAAECGDVVILKTNDPNRALDAFSAADMAGMTTVLVDGTTGEVLAIANDPNHEDYSSDTFVAMLLQWALGEVTRELAELA